MSTSHHTKHDEPKRDEGKAMGMYFMCYVHNKHEEDEQESGLSTCWRDPGHDTAINNSASDAVLPTIAHLEQIR